MEPIQFDSRQLEYLQDTSFLLTKRKISRELQQLLAQTEQELVSHVEKTSPDALPEDCLKAAGKISRGENYRGLPYLVLDYPRLFSRKDIFTFRTMCWWGHFFSCTLHLQGESFDRYRSTLRQTLPKLNHSETETFICVHKSPWEYHYGKENYRRLGELSEKELEWVFQRSFIKISRKIELRDYQQVPYFALHSFQEFLSLLAS